MDQHDRPRFLAHRQFGEDAIINYYEFLRHFWLPCRYPPSKFCAPKNLSSVRLFIIHLTRYGWSKPKALDFVCLKLRARADTILGAKNYFLLLRFKHL
jgi:hypothetical protein